MSINYSIDNSLIVSASSDKSIRIWNVATRKQIGLLQGHTDWVYSANFSPDMKFIISGGKDTTVRIWSRETCK